MSSTITVTFNGQWDPAQGGSGGDRSTAVAGRLLFNGASGVIADNANLNWNGQYMGVGVPSPVANVDINDPAGSSQCPLRAGTNNTIAWIQYHCDHATGTAIKVRQDFQLITTVAQRNIFRIESNLSNNTDSVRETTTTFQSCAAGVLAAFMTVVGYVVTFASDVIVSGILKFAGTNSTGGGSAALGPNCPAGTLTAPYTWATVKAADGSTCYLPLWK